MAYKSASILSRIISTLFRKQFVEWQARKAFYRQPLTIPCYDVETGARLKWHFKYAKTFDMQTGELLWADVVEVWRLNTQRAEGPVYHIFDNELKRHRMVPAHSRRNL